MRRRLLMTQGRVSTNSLLYIDEVEVSMLCVDGSDGKGNSYQLNAVSDDALPLKGVVWESSDPSLLTVSSSGVIHGVGIGAASLFADVTVTATHRKVVKSCLVSVYNTMPSGDVAGAGLWTIKGGSGGKSNTVAGNIASFYSAQDPGVIKSLGVKLQNYAVRSDTYNYVFGAIGGTTLEGRNAVVNSDYYSGKNGMQQRLPTYFKDVFVGTAPASGALQNLDLRNYGTTVYLNGTSYSSLTWVTGNLPSAQTLMMHFRSCDIKNVSCCADAQGSSLPAYNSSMGLYYVPQNYIRYANNASRTNYTKIINLGTLGHSYDLTANSVSSAWFTV